MSRLIRLRPVEPMPNLAPAVLARVGVSGRSWPMWCRYALAVVAAVELVSAIPGLFLGAGAASVHDGRHIGSFSVAIALGLLYVAWRPARAGGILPIVTALAATMLTGAVIDIVEGRVSTFSEGHHVLDLAGLVLVWLLAGRPLPRRRASIAQGVVTHPPSSLRAS